MRPLLRRLALVCAQAGCIAACGVAVLTVVSIVGRSWFSRPLPGDVEMSQFGIALCIALCLPWCQLHRGNIIVDFFTQKAPAQVNRYLDGIGALLLALMTGLLAWRAGVGAFSVAEAGEVSMILSLPQWWLYAAMAPGLALTALIAVAQAFGFVAEQEQEP